MSRIGKKPVPIPDGVQVKMENGVMHFKGPKGELTFTPHRDMIVEIKDKEIIVKRPSEAKFHKSLHGTTRQLIYNAVMGVKEGFKKELELQGAGYKAQMEGNTLVLNVGFSHEVRINPPQGITLKVNGPIKTTAGDKFVIEVSGIDKYLVGEWAAKIRKIRPQDPYKGKGLKYVGEHVRKKAGKAGVKGA